MSISTNYYNKWYNNTNISQKELNILHRTIDLFLDENDWGDTGYLLYNQPLWIPTVYLLYDVMKSIYSIIKNPERGYDFIDLAERATNILLETFELMYLGIDSSITDDITVNFDYRWEKTKENILHHEIQWCYALITELNSCDDLSSFIYRWSGGSRT